MQTLNLRGIGEFSWQERKGNHLTPSSMAIVFLILMLAYHYHHYYLPCQLDAHVVSCLFIMPILCLCSWCYGFVLWFSIMPCPYWHLIVNISPWSSHHFTQTRIPWWSTHFVLEFWFLFRGIWCTIALAFLSGRLKKSTIFFHIFVAAWLGFVFMKKTMMWHPNNPWITCFYFNPGHSCCFVP